MNDRKVTIHTTISTEAMRILERYEKELGVKNEVIEKALFGMNKSAAETTLKLEDRISRIKIGILHPFLGGIAEGSVFAIIGPPASGKTLLACAIVNDFLSSVEKQCVFVSNRNKLSYIIPITNSLGMNLEKYVENLFLNICDINALDGIFRMVRQSKPKIIVIDDLSLIQENGGDGINTILRSSGWKILYEEIKEQKIVCIVISEDKDVIRFCDVAIELEKMKGNCGEDVTTIRIAKNIGLIPSIKCTLEIRDRVEIVPMPAREIEITDTTSNMIDPGSFESLKKIVDETFLVVEPKQKTDSTEQPKSSETIHKSNPELGTAEKSIVKILQKNGGRISRKELAKDYGSDEDNIRNRLVKLKKKGVVNTAEEKDGRNKNVIVFLTEFGSSLNLDIANASANIQKIKQEELEIRQTTATPEIIALELTKLTETAYKDIPNVPNDKKTRDKIIYDYLMRYAENEFLYESLIAFAEKHRDQENNDVLGAIARSLPAKLQVKREIAKENGDSSGGLKRIIQLLEKSIINKKANREEKIIYALLKSGGKLAVKDLVLETGIDFSNVHSVLRKLSDKGWVSDNEQKGKEKIISINKDKILKEGLPPRELNLEEKIEKILEENGGELRQPEIARKLNLPASNISIKVIEMERAGKIAREGNRGRRGFLIQLLSPREQT